MKIDGRWASQGWLPAALGVAVLSGVVGATWAYDNGWWSNPDRAARAHGIQLPNSVRDVYCRGDAWGGFRNRGALSLFELPDCDLPLLVTHLEILDDLADDGDAPAADATPVRGGFTERQYGSFRLLHNWACRPPSGDALSVQVWKVREGVLAVNVHTQWR